MADFTIAWILCVWLILSVSAPFLDRVRLADVLHGFSLVFRIDRVVYPMNVSIAPEFIGFVFVTSRRLEGY